MSNSNSVSAHSEVQATRGGNEPTETHEKQVTHLLSSTCSPAVPSCSSLIPGRCIFDGLPEY